MTFVQDWMQLNSHRKLSPSKTSYMYGWERSCTTCGETCGTDTIAAIYTIAFPVKGSGQSMEEISLCPVCVSHVESMG